MFHVVESLLRWDSFEHQIVDRVQADRQIKIFIIFGVPDESQIRQYKIPLKARISLHILNHTRYSQILLIVFGILIQISVKFDQLQFP